MKHLTKGLFLKSIVTFLTLIFTQAITIAQDASGGQNVTTHTTTTTTTWYAQHWVWIAGAAIFILLLVALVRGGRSDKVTVTKTTSTDV
jgi:hypothetical protein